jgi:hypothetical protein
MWLSLGQGRLQLDGDSPVVFRHAQGCWVECVEGRLWLTVTGQPGDHFLVPGERVRIVSNGLALVSGFPSGTAYLYREAPWPMLRAVWALLRRNVARGRSRVRGMSKPLATWRLRSMPRRL